MQRTASLLVVSIALAGHVSTVRAQCNQNCPQRRTIYVSGTAQVTADADLAMVRVGYKLFAPDAKTAYSSALNKSNAIMQALTSSGISKSDIESTSQVLERTQWNELQEYPFNSDERKQREFTVTQSWTIRVKPDDAASALNTAITNGANESGWIQWIVNDPTALEARASADAIANAHTIAEQVAQKSGVHLGQLVNVSQSAPMAYNGPLGSVFGMGSLMAPSAISRDGQQLAINSRRVEYTVTVYAVYSIE